MSEALLIVLLVLALVALAIALRKYFALHSEFQATKTDFQTLQSSFDTRLELKLKRWKETNVAGIQKDAVERSRAVTIGKVIEHLVPYFPQFGYNPRDARFLSSPLDFIVFDGLDQGNLRKIVFVEVKTGSAKLTAKERYIQKAVDEKLVDFRVLRRPAPDEQGLLK